MEIAYTLTVKDVLQFQKRIARRNLNMHPAARWSIALLVAAFVIWIFAASTDKEGFLVSLILPAALIYICYCIFAGYSLRVHASYTPGLNQPSTFHITSEYLRVVEPYRDLKMRWLGLYAIIQDREYIFFMLTKGVGFILPKNAFLDPAQAQEFVEAALACWKAAQAGEAAPVIGESGAWPPAPRVGG